MKKVLLLFSSILMIFSVGNSSVTASQTPSPSITNSSSHLVSKNTRSKSAARIRQLPPQSVQDQQTATATSLSQQQVQAQNDSIEKADDGLIPLWRLLSKFGSYEDLNYGGVDVIDISYPRVRRYVLRKMKKLNIQPKRNNLTEEEIERLALQTSYSAEDLPSILKFGDMLLEEVGNENEETYEAGELKFKYEDIDEHLDQFVEICCGPQKFFNIQDADPKKRDAIKRGFRAMISNYTGLQRILSIIVYKLTLTEEDYDSLERIYARYSSTSKAVSDAMKRPVRIEAPVNRERCYYWYPPENKVLLAEKPVKTASRPEWEWEESDYINENNMQENLIVWISSTLCHELTHYWQYLLGIGDVLFKNDDVGRLIIRSMITESKMGYLESYFPMLQPEVLQKGVDYIKDKLPIEIDTATEEQKQLTEVNWKLLKEALSAIHFEDIVEQNMTRENIAKAIYVLCTTSFYEKNSKKRQHVWYNPLEMLTIFGLLPLNLKNETTLLVDRQNENIFRYRNKQYTRNTYDRSIKDYANGIVLWIDFFRTPYTYNSLTEEEKQKMLTEIETKFMRWDELYKSKIEFYDRDQRNSYIPELFTTEE